MNFFWRTSESDPNQKLAKYLRPDRDLDDTPVAMFRLVNGTEVGLSMSDLGDLVANHHQLVECTSAPASVLVDAWRERQLGYRGALELFDQFNELMDDRLRPQKAESDAEVEATPSPEVACELEDLMSTLRSGSTLKGQRYG